MSHPSNHSQQQPFHFGGYDPIVVDLITPIHSPTGIGSVHSPIPELIDLVTPDHSVIDLISSSSSSSKRQQPKPRKIKRPINDYQNVYDEDDSLSDISKSTSLPRTKRHKVTKKLPVYDDNLSSLTSSINTDVFFKNYLKKRRK
jgi:hypothetical protein